MTKERKRRAYWLTLFAILADAVRGEIEAHVLALVHHVITPQGFGSGMLGVLAPAHARAFQIGAGLGGQLIPNSQAFQASSQIVLAQADFLGGFVEDLDSGDPRYFLGEAGPELEASRSPSKPPGGVALLERPTPGVALLERPTIAPPERLYKVKGEWRLDPIRARAEMYAERLRGTAGLAAVESLAIDTAILWKLGPNEDHCRDCPRWANAGPYTRATLPAIPGDGTSQCKVNCHCSLWAEGQQITF